MSSLYGDLGYTTRAVPTDVQREADETMTSYATAGDIIVDVERIPLRDVEAARERQVGSTQVLAP